MDRIFDSVNDCKVRMSQKMLLHISEYVANRLIYILLRQFVNESQGDRPVFVGIRKHSRPFMRLKEY